MSTEIFSTAEKPKPRPRSNANVTVSLLAGGAPARAVLVGELPFIADEPLIADVVGSGVREEVILAGLRLVGPLNGYLTLGTVDAFAFATEGGGLAIEVECRGTARELSFSVPANASLRYFVARGPQFRKAGVIVDDAALPRLGAWLVRTGTPFPSRGLQVG